ncbi:MAG: lipid hydroperoxide peroxidase, partial [candidate division Zixibacteria bacterium]|nr:lipid hydroperoxide peroxidase [candidate division Zixibacteria bacterium]NIS44973.1 lipid hydroperoxide peroxidase [candidate division Zixibacteria bacterium]NIU13073.1 lipid hydroperoxide peroxidase [candidate division Zixibacteria bacterium]NIV05135.1 lipid hydroperoxide peroxidase [candidate division Zixibacteria bacterium]
MKYMERQGLIEVGGKDVTVVGPDMEIGQQAPDFIVIKPDYSQYEGLKETAGIVRILA